MITATYHNMLNIVNKLFGGLGSKNLKTYDKIVKKINDFEIEISKLDDQELKNKRIPSKKDEMKGSYLGPSFNNEEIEKTLKSLKANYQKEDDENIISIIANELIKEKTIEAYAACVETNI